MATKSRAVVMRQNGPPEVLGIEELLLAPLVHGEVRLRTLASAVNHSDLQIRAGHWPILREPRFPYVPGLEAVGEVVEVADGVSEFAVGDRAWTAMQGFGGVRAERDGGYAEFFTVPSSVLAPLPAGLDAVEFAAIGLAGVTAIEGMRRLGPLSGKTLVISGATGGVGAVAAGIGRALGAEVIALERGSPAPQPGSADAVLDSVAGPLFPTLVSALRPEGRYCIVGAAAGGDVAFDVWRLLDGRALTGYSTETLDGTVLRRATQELIRLRLPPPPTRVLPLAEAARAHALIEERAVRGRVVLVP
ncbi:NADPH2:quinone reductase [Stigmatella aurantiaca]|uniref:NADPH2:quinone reductase n=1 Tax=Stigmatella aurantiaca TaxID=41 RepID=A0A1H8B0K5_STIAU|nr:NADP-dependent oxidoreductase [Stigmatella aurantiaca]SEM76303.1 NADPH2:quinone reductase [Stigmatella aurantiaca]